MLIRRGDLVFDVGANIGDRTRIFLAVGARVVAFEPQPSCAGTLQRTGATVEQVALGAEAGSATMQVATATTISSMEPEWVERVRSSGRFAEQEWIDTIVVPVETLDGMIARYGCPEFCKIDVEGYEAEVLAGLTHPIPLLSLELVPERPEGTLLCLDRLAILGRYEFNFSAGETLSLDWDKWLDADDVRRWIESEVPNDGRFFGDLYARLK
jgi:FkbM family methyltransferase